MLRSPRLGKVPCKICVTSGLDVPTLRMQTCPLRDRAYEASPDEAAVLRMRQPSKYLRSSASQGPPKKCRTILAE